MADTKISLLDATNTLALQLKAAARNNNLVSTTTRSTITAQIPLDDTIPQIGEGTELLSGSLTPKSTTSRVRVLCVVPFSGNATLNVVGALFLNGGSNAVAGTVFSVNSNGFFHILSLEYEHVPGATTAQTYALRIGPGSASSVYINGQATRFLGGVMAATMSIEELLV